MGENGNSALHLAAKDSANLNIIKLLVELGADTQIKNDSGLNPFSVAEIESQIAKDPEKASKFLAIAKALKKVIGKKYNNPAGILQKSAELGDVSKFHSALMSGGSITTVNVKGENVVHKAAWHGRVSIFTSLMENDANSAHMESLINAKDNAGCTPLHNAVIRGHYDMIDVLMENGADINTTDKLGMTPLMEAVFWDKVDIVELLLSSNPDMQPKDTQGRNVHELAMKRRSKKSIEALRSYRAG